MKQIFFSLALVAILFAGFTAPAVTDAAGLVVCALNANDPVTQFDETKPCTACHILYMAKIIIDWIMTVMTVIGIAVIFAMGILYIVSAGSEKMISTAKAGIKAALIGITVIICAWLIVNTIIRISGSSGYFQGYFPNGAFEFTCNANSNAGTASSTNFGAGTAGGTGTPGGAPASGGTCKALTGTNACSQQNLGAACPAFGKDTRFSQLCNIESQGGTPNIPSGIDRCSNGSAFTGGLFQINVFSHGAKIGPQCANLGSQGKCVPGYYNAATKVCSRWACTISNQVTFNSCMQKLFDPAVNIKIACQISAANSRGDMQDWACSANKCNLGGVTGNMCKN